jgi:hypothetical protein
MRAGGVLQIELGPPTMYQSELVLRTRTGETFRALIHRLLTVDPSMPFFAGLRAVPATGHLEHDHGAPTPTEPGTPHGGHETPGGEHGGHGTPGGDHGGHETPGGEHGGHDQHGGHGGAGHGHS